MVLEAVESKLKVPADSISGEDLWRSSHGRGTEGGNAGLSSSHYKDTNPNMRERPFGVHLNLNHLSKAPALNIISLGLGLQQINFGGTQMFST